MHFSRCADGGHANCTGPAACTIAQPACLPPYTLSYTNVCFEGCVLQTECAGVDAAATDASACRAAPDFDSVYCGGTSPPHAYSCVLASLPAPCVQVSFGNVTDTYCCP
jgi:hypothetical protein